MGDVDRDRSSQESGGRPAEPRQLLDELIHLLGQPVPERERVCCLTERLVAAVADRFDRVDHSGRLEDVLVQAPWLVGSWRDLQDQQGELLASLEWACRRSREQPLTPAARRELQGELTDMVERLAEIELGLENLIQEAFNGPSWMEAEQQ